MIITLLLRINFKRFIHACLVNEIILYYINNVTGNISTIWSKILIFVIAVVNKCRIIISSDQNFHQIVFFKRLSISTDLIVHWLLICPGVSIELIIKLAFFSQIIEFKRLPTICVFLFAFLRTACIRNNGISYCRGKLMANAAIIILFEEYLVFCSKLEIKGTYLIYFTYKTIH